MIVGAKYNVVMKNLLPTQALPGPGAFLFKGLNPLKEVCSFFPQLD